MKRDELKQVVKDTVSEAVKQIRRSNPNGQQQAAPAGTGNGGGKKEQFSDREEILDAVDDAAAALADGDDDEALDILNGLLDRTADES